MYQNESGSYLASELEALEREQRAVDETAARLEVQLRKVMDRGDDARVRRGGGRGSVKRDKR